VTILKGTAAQVNGKSVIAGVDCCNHSCFLPRSTKTLSPGQLGKSDLIRTSLKETYGEVRFSSHLAPISPQSKKHGAKSIIVIIVVIVWIWILRSFFSDFRHGNLETTGEVWPPIALASP
jgi:hypothetical protein